MVAVPALGAQQGPHGRRAVARRGAGVAQVPPERGPQVQAKASGQGPPQAPPQAPPQRQVPGEDPDLIRAERDSLRTEVARLQAEAQMQRVRADSAQEALVALQARVDAGEFAGMGIHVDTEELQRLRGEVATLRAERVTHQT